MSRIKLFRLVNGLAPADRMKLADHLKESATSSSQKLFALLHESDATEDGTDALRNRLFEALFGSPYQKDKDYLLRNEFRLLLQKLRIAIPEVLMRKDLQDAAQSSLLFVKWLIAHNQAELAGDELDELERKYLKNENTRGLIQVMDLQNDLQIHHKTQTLQSAERQMEESLRRIEWLKIHALEEIRKEEIRVKHAERILLSFKANYIPIPFTESISLSELEQKSTYARYLRERAEANVAMGPEKVRQLQALANNPKLIEQFEKNPGEAYSRILINLALEYYLTGNYAEAEVYFGKAYVRVSAIHGPVREVLIYNYVYCLTKSGKYKKARELSELHRQELLESGILGRKVSLLFAMIYLAGNELDEARKFLNFDDKQDLPEFHFSIRLAHAALTYRKGNWEEALRECQNVDQAVNYTLRKGENAQVRLIKECSTTYIRFFKILLENPQASSLKPALETFLVDLKQIMTNEGTASAYGSILNIWIAREASERLGA